MTNVPCQPTTDSGHPFRTLVEMARAAQHDDRQSTGALYGKLADRIEFLEARLAIFDACCERVDCLSRGEAMKATPAQPDWNYTGPGLGGPSTKD